MKWRKGPRPWTVWVFLAFWLFVICENLLATLPPYELWETNERQVVTAFALFTGGLFPVIAIGVFASRIARALVTIMAIPLILGVGMQLWAAFSPDPFDPKLAAFSVGTLVVVGLLYLPASNRWFRNTKEWPDPELDF